MRGLTPYTRNNLANDFFRDFDNVFEGFFKPAQLKNSPLGFFPKMDVEEADKYYLVQMDVPGVKESDIEVELDGNILKISGERKREERKQGKIQSWERSYGQFTRTLQLPETAESENIEANYENGVLSLYIPKVEAKESKKIKVETGKGSFLKNLLGKDSQ